MMRSHGWALLSLLLVAGCSRRDPATADAAALDSQLANVGSVSTDTRDPALMGALQDQIMVDPALVQQSNADSVRPPARPYSGALPPEAIAAAGSTAEGSVGANGISTSETLRPAPAPADNGSCPQCEAARRALTLVALAGGQSDGQTSGCAGQMRYSAGWANRLSPDLPLYPDARVAEAAGADGRSCRVRAVSFATAAPLQRVLDWYYTKASGAGYAAAHRVNGPQHVLAGTRGRDGGAFTLYVTARGDGGSDVDLLANRGA